ncbi:serine hydrolase [Pedobacter sp. KBS0701]|uniref:serine hydrolase n=1 Tax=unclassified Pedobacter TaxID=2628915 RepID=UPI00110D7A4E|nr:serine hydrolase [Pedobacter sp. KBS0701]QDW25052.1 serine hydrolase [Pedobacter sp. KBS0701]
MRLKLKEDNTPGFSVAILNKDKVVFESGFGYADIAKRKAYTPQTIQNMVG